MRQLEDSTSVAGIDVAKAHLDVGLLGSGEVRRFEHDEAGFRALGDWLRSQGVTRVGLEATGGYERELMQHLQSSGFTVIRHQPLEVRLFARLQRVRAKNDRIDALMIAAITARTTTTPRPPSPVLLELAEWLTAYEQVTDQIARLKTACEHVHLDALKRHYEVLIRHCKDSKTRILGDILARIRICPELCQRYDLLRSLPGVGEVVAAVLVVRMPELGDLSRGQAASLIGVAPFDRDSGSQKGSRRISGGRERPRRFLYIAALTAKRNSQTFASFAARLKDAGKPPKLVNVAVMRKLIEAANIILKRQTPWKPEMQTT